MSADRASGWGNVAVLFAAVVLVLACANARAGWRAETRAETGSAFAVTGGLLLSAGALLAGWPALQAHERGGREARLAALAGALLVAALAVHSSLVVAALTCDDPSDDPKPFQLIVTK